MTVGFVGLGNMGGILAANLVAAGHDVVAFDAFAPDRTPAGASAAADLADVARRSDVVVLSLPDAAASAEVCAALRDVAVVIDTSTIGSVAARGNAAALAAADVEYVDAPVSGGLDGARARTLMVMYAGSEAACEGSMPVLEGLSDRRHRVGDVPGMAQAMKLVNNFLSATALVATSEAVAFGLAEGLDLATMLEVLNGSSGRNGATLDKFPNHVLTERYASGFANTLMAKDVRLYVDNARSTPLSALTLEVWERFAAAEPGADFTRIFPFVR